MVCGRGRCLKAREERRSVEERNGGKGVRRGALSCQMQGKRSGGVGDTD